MNRQILPDSRTRRVAVALMVATASLLLNAQPVVHGSVFYAFPFDGIGPNGYSHGKILFSELVQGADGNFYGTTVAGGSGACADGFGVEGCGTIFRITPAGSPYPAAARG